MLGPREMQHVKVAACAPGCRGTSGIPAAENRKGWNGHLVRILISQACRGDANEALQLKTAQNAFPEDSSAGAVAQTDVRFLEEVKRFCGSHIEAAFDESAMKILALAGNAEKLSQAHSFDREKPIRAGQQAGLLGRQAIDVGENDALHGPGSTGCCLSGSCLVTKPSPLPLREMRWCQGCHSHNSVDYSDKTAPVLLSESLLEPLSE